MLVHKEANSLGVFCLIETMEKGLVLLLIKAKGFRFKFFFHFINL